MFFSKTRYTETQMVIFYIVLGAFVIGAGAVASANLKGGATRRR